MGEALRYAWHGSGKRWDTGVPALVGGVLGGGVIWILGIKMPQILTDNPGFANVSAIAVGAFLGVVAIFCVRLAWWPFHKRLKQHGGFVAALRTKFGAGLLPIALAASGLFLFLAFEGAAVLVFVSQSPGTNPLPIAAYPPKASVFPVRAPSDADKEIPVIDRVVELLRDFEPIRGEGMRLVSNSFNALVRPETMPTYEADLREYGLAITAADAKLTLAKNQAPQYFEDDIEIITNKADFENLYRTFSNFTGAWFALKSIADRSKATSEDAERLMALHRAAFEKADGEFGDWITNSRESLLNRRKDLSRIAATK
jgi:hypothetical protein